ncbi:hypothetical protein PoB_006375300 [Plakobranchus ocellatus]|uniref:Uncharacterized protein n=1 Tax=Plakobranchus ocellatus TaxID=259542 RepID=A0AAV4CZC6_9GAST|nr:hypothetical protein PoB_006375300 [Plakobranchus ocellatus]
MSAVWWSLWSSSSWKYIHRATGGKAAVASFLDEPFSCVTTPGSDDFCCTTLTHNATKKTDEVQTLLQGTDLPQAVFTGRNLPEARTDPPFEAPSDSGRIQYSPPQEPDRSGQARKKQPTKQAPDVEQSGQSIQTVHSGALLRLEDVVRNLMRDVVQIFDTPQAAPLGLPPAKNKKKRCRVKDEDRTYKRENLFNICERCGQHKLKETGHKGYKGYSHCPSDRESYDEFFRRVKRLIEDKKNSNTFHFQYLLH